MLPYLKSRGAVTRFSDATKTLRSCPRSWRVTRAAGFIGSSPVELPLQLGLTVSGLDNLSADRKRSVEEVLGRIGAFPRRFRFIAGDIRDPGTCGEACRRVDVVLHQAALGSVPRSIDDPLTPSQSDCVGLPGPARGGTRRRSSAIGPCRLQFHRTQGMQVIGLRYFNVFGRRQDPEGASAGVIPKGIGNLFRGTPRQINGDGESSWDFCYEDYALQAKLMAAMDPSEDPDQVYTVACGERPTLNRLLHLVRAGLALLRPELDSEVAQSGEPSPMVAV